MPTMTPQQWAQQEIEAGRLTDAQAELPPETQAERQRRRRYVIGSASRQQEDERESGDEEEEAPLSEEAEHQKLLQQREWDDWKDDNEKGIGNRMR